MNLARFIRPLLLTVALFGAASCEYNTGVWGKYYVQNPGVPRYPLAPLERVQVATCNYGEERATVAPLKAKGYQVIGQSHFGATPQDPSQARVLGAVTGGDFVLLSSKYEGEGTASRMVVGSYTPGRVVTTDTSSHGTGYYYGDISGSASYYGSTSGSTYIPSSTTYVRENYRYNSYMQRAVVLASPERLAEIQSKGKKSNPPQ